MKRVLLFTFLIAFSMASFGFAELNIGLIDLELAMNKSDAGIKANSELKADLDKAQSKGKKLASEIEAISKEIEAQRSVLSQDAVQKKLADVQKKKVELERLEKDTADELQRKQMQLVGSIVTEMREVIAVFAKEKKFDLILEAKEAGTVYADPKLDVTEEIVKRYNTKWKSGKK